MLRKLCFKGHKRLWRITAYRPNLLLFLLFQALRILNRYEIAWKREKTTYVVEQLYCHLYIRWRSRDNDQSLSLTTTRSWSRADRARTWLHDLDLAGTHVPDFIDFAPAFPNNAPNKVIWDIDLLCLQLL
jgi:hypothetical protein